MAETSRKKTLPLAVLAAPALAFGSLTLAAAPAMAVPVDQVHTSTGDLPENVSPEISISATEAQVGETIRITINNFDAVLAAHGSDDYEISVNGDVRTGESFGQFGDAGIEQADNEATYEFTIPQSIETESGEIPVEVGSTFTFTATFVINPGVAGEEVSSYSNPVTVSINAAAAPGDDETADDSETPGDDETPDENETPGDDETPDNGEETPGDDETPDNDDETSDDGETPEVPEPVEPGLTVEQRETLLEDFIGDSEENTGVLHRVVGAAPGTEVEYSVDTPDTVAPFDDSDEADEDGVLEFWIHGYETVDNSVYLGDYTTTVSFEDAEGETQELTAVFSVVADYEVEDYEEVEDGTEDEDDEIVPVVNTEDDQGGPADNDDEAPTVGSAAQLADTGASGAQLAWIAGGLLALGGALVVFANRARLFGRQH